MRSGNTRGTCVGLAALALAALVGRAAAAPIATTADDLCSPSDDPCVVGTPFEIADDAILDFGTRELHIAGGGALDGFGGTMTILAGRLRVDTGGFVRSTPRNATTVRGGTIEVTADSALVAGTVEAAGAPGGLLQLTVAGDLTLTASGIVSARSQSRSDLGGTIVISAGSAALSGQITALGGPEEGLGGDISISVLGAAFIGGPVNGSGGDGGTIDIGAGARGGAGDLTIGEDAVIEADATASGGLGGDVDLTAEGDGITTGNLSLAGVVSADGKGSTEGGSGGLITITAKGTIRNDDVNSRISAEGGGFDGDGGEIDVTAELGALSAQGSFSASAAGQEGGAGAITIEVAGDILIGGKLAIVSGNGGSGEIGVTSDAGGVEVSPSGILDARAQSGGTGGSVCLESGSNPDGPQAVLVAGRILLDGGGGGGGGSVELVGRDAVRITGTVRAPGARGGVISVEVDPGPALIDSSLDASGSGPGSRGGIITITAASRVGVNAILDVRGVAGGGEVEITSTGEVDVLKDLRVSGTGTGGTGGVIEIVSEDDVMLASALTVDGNAGPGGRTSITGCTVTLCGQASPACPAGGAGVMSALGSNGTNRIVGRNLAVVLGTMRADVTSGRNELLYDGHPNRQPVVSGPVTPPADVIVDDSVVPCPGCGNDVIEPPETCDDGNELDGDGCSASCQTEAPIPGDANGDYQLKIDDVRFLIQEIFDGDGDSVGMVSGGGFPGGPGADANGDGRITSADIPAIIQILAAL